MGRHPHEYGTVTSDTILRPLIFILLHQSDEFVPCHGAQAATFRPSYAAQFGKVGPSSALQAQGGAISKKDTPLTVDYFDRDIGRLLPGLVLAVLLLYLTNL